MSTNDSEIKREIKEIKDLHGQMEEKFIKIQIEGKQISIDSAEKMNIYSAVIKSASAIREETLWIEVNFQLYTYYRERIRNLLNMKQGTIKEYLGKALLMEVQRTWDLMKIFIRWNTTLFQPIEKYMIAYKNETLPQSAMSIQKEELIQKFKN